MRGDHLRRQGYCEWRSGDSTAGKGAVRTLNCHAGPLRKLDVLVGPLCQRSSPLLSPKVPLGC